MVTLRTFALSLLLTLALSLAAYGETVLLDFYSDQCPPCRQMMPVIAQFEAKGYPVKKVNVTQQHALARQHGVQGIPCFVMLADGREVGRLVGYQPASELLTLYQRAGVTPELYGANGRRDQQPHSRALTDRGNRPNVPLASMPANPPAKPPVAPRRERLSIQQRAMEASVRIKIDDGRSHAYGSGTIVDAQNGEALVLTCAHIFRDGGGKGKITVDLFDKDANPIGSVDGQVIRYDMKRDVGLIAMRPGRAVTTMPVAGAHHRSARGDRVFSIGCDKGNPPTVRESRVTHINKYLGPANIEVAGAPVDGRSGGGLFTSDGKIIGVCNAADPEDDEGLYAALPTVHEELIAADLRFIFEAGGDLLAASPEPTPTTNNAILPRGMAMDSSMRADDTEVIVIVRSRSRPEEQGEVTFIRQPSRGMMEEIRNNRHEGPLPTQSMQAEAPSSSPVIRGQR